MENKTVYLKLDRNCEVSTPDVYLKDLGSVACVDEKLLAKMKVLKVYKFQDKKENRIVISAIKLIDLMQQAEKNVVIENIGEMDVVVEWIAKKQTNIFFDKLKIAMVCLLSFFGTAFTIMAFHNDIGIRELFSTLYGIVMGKESDGLGWLELFYSIGLGLGITIFFNHVGGKRITKDPTPIEVAMRTYEKDVNTALVDTAGREGKTLDVS